MDIRGALRAEHSKRQTMAIVTYIGNDPERFAELMEIFLGDEYRPTQRASWAVNWCAEKQPQLVRPYLKRLVGQLERDDVHDAVRRNVARLLQFVEIPKRLEGRIYDNCVRLADDPLQPVAVRVFAISTAARIACGRPELLNELRLIAAQHIPHTSIAFRKRAERVLGANAKNFSV